MTRHIQGSDGRFAGSIGAGKNDVPSAAPTAPTRPERATDPVRSQLHELYQRFHADHGRPPVIGLDLDGTAANLIAPLRTRVAAARDIPAHEAEQHLPDPDNYSMWKATKAWFADLDDFNDHFKKAEVEGIYREMPPINGVHEVISELRTLGFDVQVVTARSSDFNYDTRAWLDAQGLPVSDIHNPGTDKHTLPHIDVFIDDSPHVIEKLHSNDRKVVIFDQAYNRHLNESDGRVHRVTGWDLRQVTAALSRLLHRR